MRLRFLGQPVQPLEPCALHPDRRPLEIAGQEQQRGADAEADADGLPPLLDRLRQDLLLRRADREEHEPRRVVLDELAGLEHRQRVADKAHGRIVMADVAQAEAPAPAARPAPRCRR